MSKLRAVIDTNVSVSGLIFGGLPLKVVRMGLLQHFIWVISPPLLEELEQVLSTRKFSLSQAEIRSLIYPIFDVVEIVVPLETVKKITRCPGDNRVLECALEGNCEYIVTGDRRDLLSLGSFSGIGIISARQFYETCLKGR